MGLTLLFKRRPKYRLIGVMPFSSGFGADVDARDMQAISDEQTAEIRRAWLAHHVLRFRGQQLDDAAMSAFARRFGEFQIAPPRQEMDAYVSERVWHSDLPALAVPPSATLLYAIDAHAKHGRIGFINAHSAYDTLPLELRWRIEGLSLKHHDNRDGTETSQPGDDVREFSGHVHPLIITHPETGRRALFLGRRGFACIQRIRSDASKALLDELWAHTTGDEALEWWHERLPGDLLMWDNRSVLHQCAPFAPELPGQVRQIVLQGTARLSFSREPDRYEQLQIGVTAFDFL